MNVPRQLIDQEDGAGTLPGDGVLDGAVALIGIRVNLGETGTGQVQGVQLRLGPGRGGLLITVPAPFTAWEKTGHTTHLSPRPASSAQPSGLPGWKVHLMLKRGAGQAGS